MNFKQYLLESSDTNPYVFQDSNQEKLIHNGQWRELDFRHVLEGAGDIFREFCKAFADYGYVSEKIRRIERFYDNSYQTYKIASIVDKDRLLTLRKLWEEQPTSNEAQQVAIDLNLALIDNDREKVKELITVIKGIKMGMAYTGEV